MANMSDKEYLPVLVTRLHVGSKAVCSYCKQEFVVTSYVTKMAEDIDTGEQKTYLTSLASDPKDECKERACNGTK